MIIGIDLDNTLAGYDALFTRVAVAEGFLDFFDPARRSALPPGKTALRDLLRAQPGGEARWRELQALVYGRDMRQAAPFDGVRAFLARCCEQGVAVYVVSHKTQTARYGDQIFDLRAAALDWMEAHGLFNPSASPLTPERVFFESTRAEKLERIRALGCTAFIDDLVELFLEPEFPTGVQRLLFLPQGQADAAFTGLVLHNWQAIEAHLFGNAPAPESPGQHPPVPDGAAPELLAQASALLGQGVAAATRLFAGGNSRVYALTLEDGHRVALKHYFRHQDDPRDRLGVEFAALSRLWGAGLRALPEPLAASPEHGLALYTFVDGAPPRTGEPELDQAAAFLTALRGVAGSSRPEDFAWASDACRSPAGLVRALAARLEALLAPAPAVLSAPERDAHVRMRAFAADCLVPDLDALATRGAALLSGAAVWERELPLAERLPSPSDFGFHNALQGPDGRVYFLDFEYFGWDDPAKTVSDFLLHPRNPLTALGKSYFLRKSLELYRDLPGVAARLPALYPLTGLAWCAIMLNVFTPASMARRDFAGQGRRREVQLLETQLAKARTLHEALTRWTLDACGLAAPTEASAAAFPLIG